jgi:hypothetical protein
LASAEELVARLTGNKTKILRYAWIPQVLAGLFLLSLGYFMGHAHFHLIREGTRVPGRIVGYKQRISAVPRDHFLRQGICPSSNSTPTIASSIFRIGWETQSQEAKMFQ